MVGDMVLWYLFFLKKVNSLDNFFNECETKEQGHGNVILDPADYVQAVTFLT